VASAPRLLSEERWTGALAFLDMVLGLGARIFWIALGVRRVGRKEGGGASFLEASVRMMPVRRDSNDNDDAREIISFSVNTRDNILESMCR